MIAMATAASAAAMAIINMVKNTPSSLSGHRYLLNAIKFRFTLFNINSTLISMVIKFLRVKKPYTPIKNSAVLMNKIWYNPGCIFIFGSLLIILNVECQILNSPIRVLLKICMPYLAFSIYNLSFYRFWFVF